MRWRGRRQSSNIEDRRDDGMGGGFGGGMPGGFGRGRRVRRAGGGGIGFLIIAAIVLWVLGINPLKLLTGEIDTAMVPNEQTTQRTTAPGNSSARNDEMKQFVATVLAETEDTWKEVMRSVNRSYEEPVLVLFTGSVSSACGFASAASGPFYCPGDKKVYIDLQFYDELKRRFDSPGDFAQAYVLA
ncbi:MAG: neutral zinc metallopeptidase, partial [Hyphomicrobiales bacterium]|nr:neutral zinc metallopeptidase [Hyphomicrobiales bacterium]